MSTWHGFRIAKALLFCVMVAVVRTLKPQLFMHECTQLFPGVAYFQRLLQGYTVHHLKADPRDHGCPVRRPRAYDGCLRNDYVMGDSNDLQGFYRLLAKTELNAGVFLQAPDSEALFLGVGALW
jgi:hypothetical protein